MENLLKYIRSLTLFSDESWTLLQPALSEKQYKKNELILKEGEVCQSLFYIDKGYCRSYYEIDGVAKNTSFFFEMKLQPISAVSEVESLQNPI